MKLPNSHLAQAEIEKFRDYCLNSTHEKGKHKARVFKSALGFEQKDAEKLRELVLQAAQTEDAVMGVYLPLYGQTYILEFSVKGVEREVIIRTTWIIEEGKDFPRMRTCFVRE